MPQKEPQQNTNRTDWKRSFTVAFNLCLIHRQGIVLICRTQWGKNALGFPSAFALVLMLLWYAFTQDNLMLAWIGLRSVFQVIRRVEAIKLSGQVESDSDGFPFDAIRFCGSEYIAKLVVEPILVGILGAMLRWYYEDQGCSPAGLPNFLLLGSLVTMPFVASVRQAAWDRSVENVKDARLRQERMVKEHRDRYGN